MSTLKKLKQKLSHGSILVFTLLIMFILLISALGIASVTVIERKTSGTTGKSIQSFQVADSGAEIVLQKIYKDNLRTVDDLVKIGGLICSGNGIISGSIATGKDFKITFEDDSGSDITSCTDSATEISRIKSVGSYAQTSRAIEVAVAAECGSGAVTFEVAGAPTEAFSSGDKNDIRNFILDGGVLSAFFCDSSSSSASDDSGGMQLTLSGGSGIIYEFDVFFAYTSSGAGFICDSGGCDKTGAGGTCYQGWKVLGFCN